MLTKSLALWLAPARIRVNGIAPGWVATPGNAATGRMEPRGLHSDRPCRAARGDRRMGVVVRRRAFRLPDGGDRRARRRRRDALMTPRPPLSWSPAPPEDRGRPTRPARAARHPRRPHRRARRGGRAHRRGLRAPASTPSTTNSTWQTKPRGRGSPRLTADRIPLRGLVNNAGVLRHAASPTLPSSVDPPRAGELPRPLSASARLRRSWRQPAAEPSSTCPPTARSSAPQATARTRRRRQPS